MKLRMYYKPNWGPHAVVVGDEENFRNRYIKFLCSALWSDIDTASDCSIFLQRLDHAQDNPGSVVELSGNAWFIDIKSTGVCFTFATHEETQDTFTVEEVRHAVTGWRKLLQMPDSPQSEVIVEL